MRKQQQIWQEEHKQAKALPSVADSEPSRSGIYFYEFLKNHNVSPKSKILDIGCGKGRNAVYFAQQGFVVFAMDYIVEAIESAKALAKSRTVDNQIKFYQSAVDLPWPFEDSLFDAALDSYSSVDIENSEGRQVYKKELLRTLKPGGFAMVTVVSADDEMEKAMRQANPGQEKNSVIWPNGKFQKDYDRQELKDFYREFKILEFKTIKQPVNKLGKNYIATNFWLVMQKI